MCAKVDFYQFSDLANFEYCAFNKSKTTSVTDGFYYSYVRYANNNSHCWKEKHRSFDNGLVNASTFIIGNFCQFRKYSSCVIRAVRGITRQLIGLGAQLLL